MSGWQHLGGLTESPTELVWEVERAEGCDEQNDVEDENNGVDVLDAESDEKDDDIVGDERHSLGLLEGLEADGDQGPSEVWTTEELEEGDARVARFLLVKVGFDLLDLFPDELVRVGAQGVSTERS